MLQAYGVTNKGRVRATNEDFFAVDEALQLCVIADGMGGHNAGEVASRLAVDSFVAFMRAGDDHARFTLEAGPVQPNERWPYYGYDPGLSQAGNRIRTAIAFANAQILEMSLTGEEYSGMGTTVVAAIVDRGRLSIGHVGDSRLYLLTTNGLKALTRDDSWMATVLAENPGVDPAVVQTHPMRNALTNVVGMRPRTQVHILETSLAGGELFLLSTDGVHGVLDDRSLEQLMRMTTDVRQLAAVLVETAISRGSRDNCTAIVARYLPDC